MIDVDYNEYKETLAQNMKLIIENHKLKEKLNNVKNKLHEINVFEINEEAYNIILESLNILEEENEKTS